jgi:hypothetical protein
LAGAGYTTGVDGASAGAAERGLPISIAHAAGIVHKIESRMRGRQGSFELLSASRR